MVDFANKYIGGHAVWKGSCQEEILFLIFPELIVSILFNEVMTDRESIVI